MGRQRQLDELSVFFLATRHLCHIIVLLFFLLLANKLMMMMMSVLPWISAVAPFVQHFSDLDAVRSGRFWATVCKTVRPMPSDRCPVSLSCLFCLSVCLSVCDVGVLWPNGWTDQDETWPVGRPWSWPHCVRFGPSSLPQKGQSPPTIFGPCLLWPNCWMDQYATWYGGRPRPRPYCVTWGPS